MSGICYKTVTIEKLLAWQRRDDESIINTDNRDHKGGDILPARGSARLWLPKLVYVYQKKYSPASKMEKEI